MWLAICGDLSKYLYEKFQLVGLDIILYLDLDDDAYYLYDRISRLKTNLDLLVLKFCVQGKYIYSDRLLV